MTITGDGYYYLTADGLVLCADQEKAKKLFRMRLRRMFREEEKELRARREKRKRRST